MATDKLGHFPLQDVTIDFSPEARIDKYRASKPSATSLHPAVIKDAGGEIHAVAKVTFMPSAEGQQKLLQCAKINRMLQDHPNIINVYGIKEQDEWLALLLEQAVCSLRDIINPVTPEMVEMQETILAKISMKDILRQVCSAMTYVHSKTDDVNNNISHRDIKPENVLICLQKRDGSFIPKLTDFDSSKQLDVDERVHITTNVFTEEYKDPAIDDMKMDDQLVIVISYLFADIYALGVSAFELLGNGMYLFQGKNKRETAIKINSNDRSNLLESDIDGLAKIMIYTMTQSDQQLRITATEVENHIYFHDDNSHIRALNAVNEALMDLDDSKESKSIKDIFNKSFYMVFQVEWKTLDFVAPKTLEFSKYSSTLESMLRYSRNMMQHTEQHKAALADHYGVLEVSSAVVLQQMQKSTQCGLLHFYWFGQRHLGLDFGIPDNCLLAYEEWMEEEKLKIVGGVELLFERLCLKPDEATTPKDAGIGLAETFDQSFQDMRQILDKTEREFKVMIVTIHSQIQFHVI